MMEDVSKEPSQHLFFYLAVPQKPSFSNLPDIRIQRNELLRNVNRPFTWKHSQTQAAWVNSWYKEHHLLTGSILTDPDNSARHCMGLPDNLAFKEFSFLLETCSTFHIFFLTCPVSCMPFKLFSCSRLTRQPTRSQTRQHTCSSQPPSSHFHSTLSLKLSIWSRSPLLHSCYTAILQ